MKKIFVGNFEIGLRSVDLWVVPDSGGGTFWTNPESGIARIEIGFDQYDKWSGIVSVLLHESYELIATDMGVRFDRAPSRANDQASYIFVMDHTQFGELHGRVSYFLTACMAKLADKVKIIRKRRKWPNQ